MVYVLYLLHTRYIFPRYYVAIFREQTPKFLSNSIFKKFRCQDPEGGEIIMTKHVAVIER
jgi:hypothetical protein